MRKLILSLLILVCLPVFSIHHVVFTADETSIFPNPERGFTEELGGETKLSDSQNHVVKPEEEWFWDEEDENYPDRKNQTLVMLMYYLYNYKTKDLSNKLLQGFDEDMQILRNHGFKCVLRFAYDWKSKNDASLEWVHRHIAQLKPHLEKNADVIYVLEAGFVGEWGEWYYSSNFGNGTQHLNVNRRAVLDSLLAAVPENRFLLVRYPLIKLQYFGDEVPLTEEQAFSGSARAKLGHHNDAFLAEWGNDGTYGRDGEGPDDDPLLRQYIASETLYVPNGGETNVEDSTWAKQVYMNATTEMSQYHWSFCGSTYSEQITDRWRASGIFDELNRKMGYRYELVNADLPETAVAGQTAHVSIKLKNVGYAPLYNERKAYLVLKSAMQTCAVALNSDPRRWKPNGVETVIDETLTIPSSLPADTYQLYLHLPDMASSLADDPRYAVRFANVGTWDAATGMNSLLTSVQITESGTEGVVTADHPLPQSSKILIQGKLLIRRGNLLFTPQGQQVE